MALEIREVPSNPSKSWKKSKNSQNRLKVEGQQTDFAPSQKAEILKVVSSLRLVFSVKISGLWLGEKAVSAQIRKKQFKKTTSMEAKFWFKGDP